MEFRGFHQILKLIQNVSSDAETYGINENKTKLMILIEKDENLTQVTNKQKIKKSLKRIKCLYSCNSDGIQLW